MANLLKLAVVLPTRGTIFTRTIASVLANLERVRAVQPIYIFSTWPIPQSFNQSFQLAKDRGADLIWLVEDDIEPSSDALAVMMRELWEQKADVMVADYTLDTGNTHLVFHPKEPGSLLYAGTGCVLLRTSVLDGFSIAEDYFSAKVDYVYRDGRLEEQPASKDRWGGQDVYFFRKVTEAGAVVRVSSVFCNHMRIREYGEHFSNNGLHKIENL